MVAHVQKWGNSLAVRIPRTYAAELGLGKGTRVDIAVVDGEVRIRPVREQPQLADLVRRINPDNVHGEVDHGASQGREAW